MPSRISLDKIESPNEAIFVARMRNEVKGFMTHNQNNISDEQQVEWYEKTYKPAHDNGEMFAFLLRDELGGQHGYGFISERDDKFWISGGLVSTSRGLGYGKFLFRELTKFVHESIGEDEVWLDVLATNQVALGLYRSIGYKELSAGDLIVMVHRGEVE